MELENQQLRFLTRRKEYLILYVLQNIVFYDPWAKNEEGRIVGGMISNPEFQLRMLKHMFIVLDRRGVKTRLSEQYSTIDPQTFLDQYNEICKSFSNEDSNREVFHLCYGLMPPKWAETNLGSYRSISLWKKDHERWMDHGFFPVTESTEIADLYKLAKFVIFSNRHLLSLQAPLEFLTQAEKI